MEGAIPSLVAVDLGADVLIFPIMISHASVRCLGTQSRGGKDQRRAWKRGPAAFFHTSSFFAVSAGPFDESTILSGRLASFIFRNLFLVEDF